MGRCEETVQMLMLSHGCCSYTWTLGQLCPQKHRWEGLRDTMSRIQKLRQN